MGFFPPAIASLGHLIAPGGLLEAGLAGNAIIADGETPAVGIPVARQELTARVTGLLLGHGALTQAEMRQKRLKVD